MAATGIAVGDLLIPVPTLARDPVAQALNLIGALVPMTAGITAMIEVTSRSRLDEK